MSQSRTKEWCLSSVGLSVAHGIQTDRALDDTLRASAPMSLFIHDAVWALRRRVPFHDIIFQITDQPPRAPYQNKNMISNWLAIEVPYDLNAVRHATKTDTERTAICQDIFSKGLDYLPDDLQDLRSVILTGLEAAKTANYVAPLHRPDRSCVVGAEVLIEVTYLRTPSQKRCHLRLWRPGNPKHAYVKEFEILPEPVDPASKAVRMYEYTPIQGAILMDNMIRMGQTSWDDTPENGMTPNPLMTAYDIPLAILEKAIGPVKRAQ